MKQLPGLVTTTSKQFDVKEVSADLGYSGRNVLHAIDAVGAKPFVPFQQQSTGLPNTRRAFDPLWQYMHAYYNYNRREFLDHYYKRNNVETTMFMVKSKFGGAVKSKSPTGQVNEVLCKALAHNIVVLVQSMYELGIQPAFCAEMPVAQKGGRE